MRITRLFQAVSALLVAGALAACNDSTEPSVLSDDQVSEDLAVSSAEAVVSDIGELLGNEVFAGLPAPPARFDLFSPHPPGWNVVRSRTCYDAQGGQQTQCDPVTTATIVLQLSIDGSFSRTVERPTGTETMSAAVHRTRTTEISGLAGLETSRTHNGVGSSNDTTTFTGTDISRTMAESSLDSTISVVFNLPHASNPWPVSGKIVRYVNATITVTGARNDTRTVSRRIEVTFPPDAQGNVTIRVGDRTCTLNLVTHRVTNCQG